MLRLHHEILYKKTSLVYNNFYESLHDFNSFTMWCNNFITFAKHLDLRDTVTYSIYTVCSGKYDIHLACATRLLILSMQYDMLWKVWYTLGLRHTVTYSIYTVWYALESMIFTLGLRYTVTYSIYAVQYAGVTDTIDHVKLKLSLWLDPKLAYCELPKVLGGIWQNMLVLSLKKWRRKTLDKWFGKFCRYFN